MSIVKSCESVSEKSLFIQLPRYPPVFRKNARIAISPKQNFRSPKLKTNTTFKDLNYPTWPLERKVDVQGFPEGPYLGSVHEVLSE